MKKIFAITLAAACILSLSACGKAPEEKVNLTVVAARMANQPAPSLQLIQTDLEQAAQTGGKVFLIRPHVSPDLVETIYYPEQDALMLPSQLQRIVGEQVSGVMEVASQVTATESECDLLGGLRLAGRTAQPADGERSELVILNSGLSTVAPLDLSQCLLENLDIQATVSRLQAEFALADLSGYDTVRFYQLGDTAAPQEDLTPAGRQKLRELWEAILVASGAQEVSFPDNPPTDSQPSENLPSVKTVSVLKSSNAVQGSALDVSFDEQAVGFAPDTAQFLDPEAARQALVPTAQALAADPSQKALVVGQTATSADAAGSLALSRERAQAVSGLLQEMGVAGGQLEVLGVGCNPANPLHTPDVSASGALVEEAAAKNRIVSILRGESSLAQALRSLGQ